MLQAGTCALQRERNRAEREPWCSHCPLLGLFHLWYSYFSCYIASAAFRYTAVSLEINASSLSRFERLIVGFEYCFPGVGIKLSEKQLIPQQQSKR